jgi:hypothetical protein
MHTGFEDFNLYVYNSIQGLFLDLVIWCLGPMVYESRDYGLFRHYLAFATAKVCRSYMRLHR